MAVHTEYLIEYDEANLVVYLSGLDKDGFWDEITCYDDVNNPEEFAEGLKEGLTVFGSMTITIAPIDYSDLSDYGTDD